MQELIVKVIRHEDPCGNVEYRGTIWTLSHPMSTSPALGTPAEMLAWIEGVESLARATGAYDIHRDESVIPLYPADSDDDDDDCEYDTAPRSYREDFHSDG